MIEPKVFGDERGFFFESFNQAKFEAAIGRQVNFVQDNHSKSTVTVRLISLSSLPEQKRRDWSCWKPWRKGHR